MKFFKDISDSDEIRQGDIIRMCKDDTTTIFGVIVTADCDIAQKKAGDKYTWLEILPMKKYIEGPWAEVQLKKLLDKRIVGVCDTLNAKIKKLGEELTPLTPQSLSDWLKTSTSSEILEAIDPSLKSQLTLARQLDGLSIAVNAKSDLIPLSNLLKFCDFFDIPHEKQKDSANEDMKKNSGFQDYFVLPELPKTEGVGFVVMLRSISTVTAADLYMTAQEARINDKPNSFHRVGRLNDVIRFSITQKLAFLFSRIGLPTVFESSCMAAIDLAVDELF